MSSVNNPVPSEFLSAARQPTILGYLDQRLVDTRNSSKKKVNPQANGIASTKRDVKNSPEFASYLIEKLEHYLKLGRLSPKAIQKSVYLLKGPSDLIKIFAQAQGINVRDRRALESYEMRLSEQFKQSTSA